MARMTLPAPSHARDLTDQQGFDWALLPRLARRTDGGGAHGGGILRCSTAFCGSSGPAPHGPTSRTGIPPIKRATGGFSSGCAPVCCGALSRSSPSSPRRKAIWICTIIDRSFAPAKRGAAKVGKTKRGKGSKITAISDRRGLPGAVHIESATPHEVTLVYATRAQRFIKPFPVRLIGDNADESDRLDAVSGLRGVELNARTAKTRTSPEPRGAPAAVAGDGGGGSSE